MTPEIILVALQLRRLFNWMVEDSVNNSQYITENEANSNNLTSCLQTEATALVIKWHWYCLIFNYVEERHDNTYGRHKTDTIEILSIIVNVLLTLHYQIWLQKYQSTNLFSNDMIEKSYDSRRLMNKFNCLIIQTHSSHLLLMLATGFADKRMLKIRISWAQWYSDSTSTSHTNLDQNQESFRLEELQQYQVINPPGLILCSVLNLVSTVCRDFIPLMHYFLSIS